MADKDSQFETSWAHARDEGQRRRRKREVPGPLGSPAGQHEGTKEENKRETREKGRKTASIFAGGTFSEIGCDGLSGSTEPDEGVSLASPEAAPPSNRCFIVG